MLNVLFVGDVVGDAGIQILSLFLPKFLREQPQDLVIANGENLHTGKSLNITLVKTLLGMGVHVVTGGNHTFERFQAHDVLRKEKHVLRPHNYPPGVAGSGVTRWVTESMHEVTILNLQGRTFLRTIDCPFRTADEVLRSQKSPLVIVDFHAEATAEKQALAWHLDGKISALLGTHTHVPTADHRILPGGTGYMTDVGMTGSYDSVIGMDSDVAVKRFVYQTPFQYKAAGENPQVAAVQLEIDPDSGKTTRITPILWPGL